MVIDSSTAIDFTSQLRNSISGTFLSEMLLPLFVAANEEFCDRTLPLLPFPETATGSDPLPSSGAQLPQKWCKQATNLLKTSHVWSDRRLLQWWKKLSAAQAACPGFSAALLSRLLLEIRNCCLSFQSDQSDGPGREEGQGIPCSDSAADSIGSSVETAPSSSGKYTQRRLGRLLLVSEMSLLWVRVTVSLVYSLLDLPHVPEDGVRDEARKVFLGNADKLRSSGSHPPSTSLRRLLLPLYLEACSSVSHQFPRPQPAAKESSQASTGDEDGGLWRLFHEARSEIARLVASCASSTSSLFPVDNSDKQPVTASSSSSSLGSCLMKRKRSPSDSPGGKVLGVQLMEGQCWPLGLVPGALYNPLYLLRSQES